MTRPRSTRARHAACSLLALALGWSGALAQPADPFAPRTPPGQPSGPFPPASGTPSTEPTPTPAGPDPNAAPPTEQTTTIEDLVPQLRCGYKAEFLRQQQKAIPVVVIVPEAGSYLRALSAWKPLVRFPILIDDGTTESRENIARFVRAFKPERVVRWAATDAPALDTEAQVRGAAEDALRAVWNYGGADVPLIGDAVRAVAQAEAPGVVVANPDDPAWTAGLALAVGRGQPIVWIDARQNVDDALSREEGDALCSTIEQSLTALGMSWNTLGDAVDTIALCMNTPVRTTTATAGEWIATTDRIGHTSDGSLDRARWAWTSQIHGSNAQATYRAMCALFLTLPSGWFFDSYPDGQPWASFALRFARDYLGGEGGLKITLTERPANGIVAWSAATTAPVDAAFLMVNTKGMRQYFELQDGTGWCGDVPFLNQPSALYFIHSWSAFQPGDRNTLAGRWFERGVFAYCGSVQEPYLSAFVPPVAIAARLGSLAPWAVACRGDEAPAWRVATFGDPLLTIARPQDRSTEALPLEGAAGLDDAMREALRAGDFTAVTNLLVMLGRDADAARLVSRLRVQEPSRVTPALAAAALAPLFRCGQHADLQALYGLLDDAGARDPENLDLLWLSCRASLPARGSVMGLLRTRIRPEQEAADMTQLALMAAASGQREPAISMLTEYRRSRSDVSEIRMIDFTMQRIRGK